MTNMFLLPKNHNLWGSSNSDTMIFVVLQAKIKTSMPTFQQYLSFPSSNREYASFFWYNAKQCENLLTDALYTIKNQVFVLHIIIFTLAIVLFLQIVSQIPSIGLRSWLGIFQWI